MEQQVKGVLWTLIMMLSFSTYAFDIRVLLDKREEEGELWEITSSQAGGFYLSDISKNQSSHLKVEKVTIQLKNKVLYLNNKKLATNNIALKPVNGFLQQDNKQYEGFFVIVYDQDQAYLINSVDFEAYVYSVLRWEGWPGWSEQVNMVFAIVYRTYAAEIIARQRERKKQGKKVLYDVKCTNAHQTYKGLHEFEHLREICEATRGIVLAYNKKPIIAMYDACCGGVIPAHLKDIKGVGAPYLVRNYACTHCKDSKLYAWRAEYSLAEIEHLLHKESTRKGRIHDLKIVHIDKAGVVERIKIKRGSQWSFFTGKDVYRIFKKVRSLCFTVYKEGQKIIFEGRGYGHLRGMCQWGVREMVKQGADYKKVLNFYYPGTSFMKIEYLPASR